MSLFEQEQCQKPCLKGPKGKKIHLKEKQKGVGREEEKKNKTSMRIVIIPST